MSGNGPDAQARRAGSNDGLELTLDIERVLDVRVRQPVRAHFRFDPQSPLAVGVEFLVAGGPRVAWRIGRDLLRQGLHSVSGLGDVQVWPSHPDVGATARLRLASRDMAALFELPAPALAAWLDRTYELVPAGHELAGIDWDAATTDLLKSPGSRSD